MIAPVILVVVLELLAFGIHKGMETVARRIANDAAVHAAQTGESHVERIEIAEGFLDENRDRYNLVDTDRFDISARHHPEDQDILIVAANNIGKHDELARSILDITELAFDTTNDGGASQDVTEHLSKRSDAGAGRLSVDMSTTRQFRLKIASCLAASPGMRLRSSSTRPGKRSSSENLSGRQ